MAEQKELRRVIPIDWYELLIELDDVEVRSFEPSKQNLYNEYKFLAYPDKLRSFSFNRKGISWKNGVTFDLEFLIEHSIKLNNDKLIWKALSIGRKNQAPTSEHKSHHIYDVAIRPYNQEIPVIISESIGGGLGDRGGSRNVNLDEIRNNEELKKHFELSDAHWAFDKLSKINSDFTAHIDSLLDEYLKRNY